MNRMALLLPLALAACGGESLAVDEPASTGADAPVASSGPPPRTALPPSAPATGPGGASSWDGLIQLPGVKALPAEQFVETPGYPGSGFHLGVFHRSDEWERFAAAAGVELGPTDWDRQVVAYVVLDAQTNRLAWKGLSRTGDTAVLAIEWSGIEPYYPDSTPAVLAVIDRAGTRQIRVELTEDRGRGRLLGTIPLAAP